MYHLKNLGELISLVELTNTGSLGNLKKWVGHLSDGTRLYMKAPSTRRGTTNYECESECIACRLAMLLGIGNVVMYHLDTLYDGKRYYKVCVSKDFVDNGVYKSFNSLIPDIAMYEGVAKYNRIISSYPNIRSQLDTILLFDAIILNKDRHLRNMGVLNGVCVPLFDNGNSLFYDANIYFIRNILKTNLDYQPCKPFMHSLNGQLRLINYSGLRNVSKVDVYRLVNSYLGGNRAKYINKVIITRLERFGLLCV